MREHIGQSRPMLQHGVVTWAEMGHFPIIIDADIGSRSELEISRVVQWLSYHIDLLIMTTPFYIDITAGSTY